MTTSGSVGLDVGGTYLKAAWLGDSPPRVIRRVIPEFAETTGSSREIDPAALMKSVTELLAEVIGRGSCKRIFITGQMAGLAFVDSQGRPLAPLISWQDTRFDAVESVRSQLSPADLSSLGDGLRVGLPLVTLSELDFPRHAFVTSLIGFVAGALIGSRATWIHSTDAASLGLLDVVKCHWSSGALDVAKLPKGSLPSPVADVLPLGTDRVFGAEVMTPVGDQQASLLGSGLTIDEISMNIGTGCQVSVLSLTPASPAQLRPYFTGKFLQTVTHLPAGRILTTAVKDQFGDSQSKEAWEQAARSADDLSSPVGHAVNAITGACIDAAHILGTGSSIAFTGGVSRKFEAIRQRIADKLGLPFRLYSGDDAALAGLQVLASECE